MEHSRNLYRYYHHDDRRLVHTTVHIHNSDSNCRHTIYNAIAKDVRPDALWKINKAELFGRLANIKKKKTKTMRNYEKPIEVADEKQVATEKRNK